MKKNIFIFLVVFLFTAVNAVELDEFIAKAEHAGKTLAKKEAEQTRFRKRYEYTAKKIGGLKEQKAKGGFGSAVSSMRLSYYLKAGNKAGYRLYLLNGEINELKESRFTYVMIIMDEYAKRLRECFRLKCPDAGNLYAQREKWMASLEDYRDMLKLDFDIRGMMGALSGQAKEDLKKYIEGKIVQADERIYLLKEEKEISKEAAAAGIKVDKKYLDMIDEDMAYMEMMKKKMREVLEK